MNPKEHYIIKYDWELPRAGSDMPSVCVLRFLENISSTSRVVDWTFALQTGRPVGKDGTSGKTRPDESLFSEDLSIGNQQSRPPQCGFTLQLEIWPNAICRSSLAVERKDGNQSFRKTFKDDLNWEIRDA